MRIRKSIVSDVISMKIGREGEGRGERRREGGGRERKRERKKRICTNASENTEKFKLSF